MNTSAGFSRDWCKPEKRYQLLVLNKDGSTERIDFQHAVVAHEAAEQMSELEEISKIEMYDMGS